MMENGEMGKVEIGQSENCAKGNVQVEMGKVKIGQRENVQEEMDKWMEIERDNELSLHDNRSCLLYIIYTVVR